MAEAEGKHEGKADGKGAGKARVAEELASSLRELIVEGQIGAGDALPSERELAAKFEVNRSSVREALHRLEAVGLADMGHKFPAEISGGMRKRVALARALVTDPEIVLFDEPTTGLDPIMLHAIHRLIAETHERFGFTGVVVSHDVPDVFDIAHQVAMLHEGTIVVAGPPDQVRRAEDPRVRQFIAGSSEGPIRPT